MWEMLWDILVDAVLDGLKMLPFLFAAYLLIEYIEHKASDKLTNALRHSGKLGVPGGALLGAVPQCGFSVAAANFFAGRIITPGTLIAVFVATSDEAIPMLLANAGDGMMVLKLIAIKTVIAVIAGYLVDLVLYRNKNTEFEKEELSHELCKDCGCEHGIVRSAIRHTVNIFIFVLLVTFLLNLAIEWIGEDMLGQFMLTDSVFQPFLSALVGFIPNCASSVVLTQLMMSGSISFGSAVAGLCTGAGIGLAVLFRVNKNLKENLTIMGILYVVGVVSGVILQQLKI